MGQRSPILGQLREKVKQSGSESLVYVYESGFSHESYRPHGWEARGQRVYGDYSGERLSRTSLLLAQCSMKRFSPLLFSGTCTTALFNRWLEQSLLPQLRPGQTVVMDNAAIHKSKETKQLIGKAGCELLFLPPYSPDFNPIEKTFGILKKRRQFMPSNTTLDDVVCSIL